MEGDDKEDVKAQEEPVVEVGNPVADLAKGMGVVADVGPAGTLTATGVMAGVEVTTTTVKA